MRVAVLGAGNGGLASAFDFAKHGHEVSLYATPEFGTNVVAVDAAGAELVVVVGPAYATEPLAAAAGPHLTDGVAVLVCPGSCGGAIAFKHAAGLALDDDRCVVGESHT